MASLRDAILDEASGPKRKLMREAASALEAKEAELAAVKMELDCALIREGNEKHHAKIAHQNMNAEINARERVDAALAEARKALEPFAAFAEEMDTAPNGYPWKDTDHILKGISAGSFRAARRALAGGQADG